MTVAEFYWTKPQRSRNQQRLCCQLSSTCRRSTCVGGTLALDFCSIGPKAGLLSGLHCLAPIVFQWASPCCEAAGKAWQRPSLSSRPALVLWWLSTCRGFIHLLDKNCTWSVSTCLSSNSLCLRHEWNQSILKKNKTHKFKVINHISCKDKVIFFIFCCCEQSVLDWFYGSYSWCLSTFKLIHCRSNLID